MRLSGQIDLQQGRLTDLVRALMSMPEALRPNAHSSGERNKRHSIESQEEIVARVATAGTVPWLTAPRASYDIYSGGPFRIVCHARMNVPPDLVREFLVTAAAADPTFGRVATDDEVNSRHFLKLRTKTGTLEGLFGRDSTRYIPGLYWWTLIADGLAKRHGVDIDQLASIARGHERLAGNLHLLRFYDAAGDWKPAVELDEMLGRNPGIFDIRRLQAILSAVHDDQRRDDELLNWA